MFWQSVLRLESYAPKDGQLFGLWPLESYTFLLIFAVPLGDIVLDKRNNFEALKGLHQ